MMISVDIYMLVTVVCSVSWKQFLGREMPVLSKAEDAIRMQKNKKGDALFFQACKQGTRDLRETARRDWGWITNHEPQKGTL
jgi:hypothetical protein